MPLLANGLHCLGEVHPLVVDQYFDHFCAKPIVRRPLLRFRLLAEALHLVSLVHLMANVADRHIVVSRFAKGVGPWLDPESVPIQASHLVVVAGLVLLAFNRMDLPHEHSPRLVCSRFDLSIWEVVLVRWQLFGHVLGLTPNSVKVLLSADLLIVPDVSHLLFLLLQLLEVLLLEPFFELELLRHRVRIPLFEHLIDLLLDEHDFASAGPLVLPELFAAYPSILRPENGFFFWGDRHLLLRRRDLLLSLTSRAATVLGRTILVNVPMAPIPRRRRPLSRLHRLCAVQGRSNLLF